MRQPCGADLVSQAVQLARARMEACSQALLSKLGAPSIVQNWQRYVDAVRCLPPGAVIVAGQAGRKPRCGSTSRALHAVA